jgi:hypothetical protein
MIYYQAVCRTHGWRSRLFVTELGAINSANAYRNENPGPHDMVILQVLVPTEVLQVQSEKVI